MGNCDLKLFKLINELTSVTTVVLISFVQMTPVLIDDQQL